MLKLLKYELIGSYRQYVLTFLVFLMGCVALPFISTGLGQTLLSGFFMIAIFGIAISIFINIILAFNNSMFKRPGYLTLTLPVTSTQIILSKVIGALIWSLLASFILFIGMGILMFIMTGASISDFINGIGPFFKQIWPYLSSVLGQLAMVVVELVVTILSFYFTVTFVHTRFVCKYKALVGIVGYFVVSLLGGYVISLPFISDFITSLNIMEANIVLLLASIVTIAGFFFGTKYLIDTQIEVE